MYLNPRLKKMGKEIRGGDKKKSLVLGVGGTFMPNIKKKTLFIRNDLDLMLNDLEQGIYVGNRD